MSSRFHLWAVASLSLAACQAVHGQDATATPAPAAATPPAAPEPSAEITVPPTPAATAAPATPAPTAAATPAATATTPAATATATPAAKQRLTYSSIKGVGMTIAMTFDDGPNPKLTPMLLDMLKQRGIHATFFVVGENAAKYPEILKRAVSEGHEIGDHSWSHPQFTHLTIGNVDSEVQRTSDAIKAATGHAPVLLRPPYGATTAALDRHFVQDFGMKVILWSVDPLDWKYRDSARVEKEILQQVGPGGIVLSHDIHATTVAAMPETLDALIARGYKFVTVSQLIAMEGSVPTPTPSPTPVKPAKSGKSAKHKAS